jgi:hypothetical protein
MTHHSDAVWDLRSSRSQLASTGMDGRLAVFEATGDFNVKLKFCIQGVSTKTIVN